MLTGTWLVSASDSIRAAPSTRHQDAASSSAAAPPAPSAEPRAVFEKYCFTCHNQRLRTAGLALDTLDVENVGADAEAWAASLPELRNRLPRVGERGRRAMSDNNNSEHKKMARAKRAKLKEFERERDIPSLR